MHSVPLHDITFSSLQHREETCEKHTHAHTLNILAACGCFGTFGFKFHPHKSAIIAMSPEKGEVAIF